MERQTTKSVQNRPIENNTSEAEIRELFDKFAASIREGDLDSIMSFYDKNVVAFDMMPPLEVVGSDTFRQSWENCFTSHFDFPVDFEFIEPKIYVDGNIAFSHCLIYMQGIAKDGKQMEAWMRNTSCLKRVSGVWTLIHEHNSVPLDMASGTALLNLKPDRAVH